MSFLSGARAVRVIMRQASPSGSFDAPPSNGTTASPGSGHPATRIFNADGSLLASGSVSTSTTWPKWFQLFEVGVSGSSNTSAVNPACAGFASATEATATNCNFGAGSGSVACGAASGQYRVSEWDCMRNPSTTPPSAGTGGPSDGIYLRAVLSRTYLSSTENVMVVVEYAASGLNTSPTTPTNCFSGGSFTPENCSDFTWKIYLKHSASEVVQPYLLFVPPVLGAVNTTTQTGGGGIATKQFYVPLAADQSLTTVQISRTNNAITDNATFDSTCSDGAGTGNSPLCVGMILYSVTFYRI